jgi:hypothetical protein
MIELLVIYVESTCARHTKRLTIESQNSEILSAANDTSLDTSRAEKSRMNARIW